MAIKLYPIVDGEEKRTGWFAMVDMPDLSTKQFIEQKQVEDTITQIEKQLAALPDLSKDEMYLTAIIGLVNKSVYTAEQKADAVKLLQNMWNAYSETSDMLENIALQKRIDELKAILTQMEA